MHMCMSLNIYAYVYIYMCEYITVCAYIYIYISKVGDHSRG